VNWEADSSTAYLAQRPLAATSRASQDGASVKHFGSNCYLILRKVAGALSMAAKLVFLNPGRRARTSEPCGLSAAGEHLSTSEKYVNDIAEPRPDECELPTVTFPN
jgi:hypothetical protein